MSDNDEDEAAEQGKRAATNEESTESNPFPVGSRGHEAWTAAWMRAKAFAGDAAPDDI